MKSLCDRDAIVQAVRLIVPSGDVTELRALKANTDGSKWTQTLSGFFDDAEMLADAAMTIKRAKGIYIIPNELDPALLARAANRFSPDKDSPATSDNNVIRRRWFLVDVDCERPAGISATDEEVLAAVERAKEIYKSLHGLGWPEPLAGRSGNGCHLMYRIDLPAADDGLIQRCLEALSQRFTRDAVKVDTSVFNPARIWKLYGTLACKGDDTPERPHRMAEVRKYPEQFEVVPMELLKALAGEVKKDPPRTKHNSNGQSFDIEAFIRTYGLEVDGPKDWPGQGRKWTLRKSPMCDHGGDGPFIAQMTSAFCWLATR